MLENKYKQMTISEHISLYDKIIPKDHFLRKLKENIDFSFVNKLLEKEYSEKMGRPATEPEMMYKLLFLQTKDLLTDREVVERAKTDMAYKYFLDLNPEDEVPSYSLLSIFRHTKIKDEEILEEMLRETVKQAIEKGIIKSNSIIVDSTHTNSKTKRKSPTQILREASKNLRKEIYKTEPEWKEKFPTKPEETASLEEEIEYTQKLVKVIEEKITEETDKKIKKRYEKVKEMLKDEKIRNIQSGVDEDAKSGYKSKEKYFFGYKSHVAMTPERIVTGIEVTSGEASDGKQLKKLIEKSEKSGIEVKEVIGDRAYSGRENIEYGHEKGIKIIAPRNMVITNSRKTKEEGFEYIKDAGTVICPMGYLAKRQNYKKPSQREGYRNGRMEYEFDKEKCKECARRESCLGKNKKRGKRYSITIMCEAHKEQQKFERTEYFRKKLEKERYKIEAKNAETKLTHGLIRARSVGLLNMRIQSYITHIVTNIKRIMRKIDDSMAIE